MTFSVRGYQVGELLGRGSRSEVFSAVNKRSGDRVALKRIQISTDQSMAGARAEAALLAALQHPNLIGFFEFIEANDHAILVLELAAGGSLADLLRRRDRLTPAEVGMCFSDLAVAVAHAHSHEVLHGDISAGNVLYASDGRPKLADLGVARIVGEQMLSLGTPAYLDPVVAAGGATGPASDVFSLAAVALHALTGAGPWSAAGAGADEVLKLAENAHIGGLAQRLSGCPAAMSAALIRALDPDPGRRGSAAELALDLRAALVGSPVALSAGQLNPAPRTLTGAPEEARAPQEAGAPDKHLPVVSTGEASFTQLHRPHFDRPAGAMLPADLTHVSRPNVRSLLASTPQDEPRRRHRIVIAAAAAAAVGALCVVVVLLGVGPGTIASLGSKRSPSKQLGIAKQLGTEKQGNRSEQATAAPGTAAASPVGVRPADQSTAAVNPTLSKTAVQRPSSSPSPAAPVRPSPAAVTATLSAIDTHRAAAFRQRDPAGLAQVYSSPGLRSQDSAQLLRSVPAGCGITGLVTSYRHLVVTAGPGRIELTADVSTSAATLMCAGKVTALVAATPARMMRLTLTGNPAAGYLISSQREQA